MIPSFFGLANLSILNLPERFEEMSWHASGRGHLLGFKEEKHSWRGDSS